MLSNIGPTEIIIGLVVLSVILGGKKMTEVARGLGETRKEYKKIKNEYEEAVTEVPKQLAEAVEDKAEDEE